MLQLAGVALSTWNVEKGIKENVTVLDMHITRIEGEKSLKALLGKLKRNAVRTRVMVIKIKQLFAGVRL